MDWPGLGKAFFNTNKVGERVRERASLTYIEWLIKNRLDGNLKP